MHWWRHRSDRTKIGDIKKTVAAFSLQHGVYTQLKPPSLNTLKSCKTKTNPKFGGALFSRTSEFSTHQNNLILAFHQFEAHWLSKTISVIPRLFKEDFVLTFFESKAKHRFCFRGWTRLQEFGLYASYLWDGLQDDVIKAWASLFLSTYMAADKPRPLCIKKFLKIRFIRQCWVCTFFLFLIHFCSQTLEPLD